MASPHIYEVNIKVPIELYEDYVQWLHDHVEDMLALPYFSKAQVFTSKDLQNEEKSLSVHYHLTGPEAFDDYIREAAGKMRTQLPEAFQGQLSFQREILSPLSK